MTTFRRILITCGFCVVFFIVIPLLIYYFSYYWHMQAQGGLTVQRVVDLQETLYKLGYLGTITGEFDSATVEAVKNCQRRNGLSATGKADQEFQRLIYLREPKPAW